MRRSGMRRPAVAAAALVAFGCLSCSAPTETGAGPTSQGEPVPSSTAPSGPSSAAVPGAGLTTAADTFGPACSLFPAGDEPGSLQAMSPQPVATAVSANPVLTILTQAVGAVPGLVDALNAAPALTVFAPSDAAFVTFQEEQGEQGYAALLADPQQIGNLLGYHVSATRYDRAGLVQAGTVATMNGTVQVADAGDTITVNGASVVCGNVPTANATVFVIDTVLTPPT